MFSVILLSTPNWKINYSPIFLKAQVSTTIFETKYAWRHLCVRKGQTWFEIPKLIWQSQYVIHWNGYIFAIIILSNVLSNESIKSRLQLFSVCLQLWSPFRPGLCHGPRDVYDDDESILQEEERSSGDHCIGRHRTWNCNILKHIQIRDWVS